MTSIDSFAVRYSISHIIIAYYNICVLIFRFLVHGTIHISIYPVITVTMNHILSCCILHAPISNNCLPTVLLHAMDVDLTLAMRIILKHPLQDINTPIRSTVINKQILNIIKCLFKKTSSTTLYIFFYPVNRDNNAYFGHSIPLVYLTIIICIHFVFLPKWHSLLPNQ